MKTLMGIFLIGHLIADFLLQSTTMAELKKENKKYRRVHGAIYAVIFVVLSFVCLTPKFASICSAIIATTHYIVDCLRILIDKKVTRNPRMQFTLFIIDQIIHISIIFILYYLLNLNTHITNLYCKVTAIPNFSSIVLYILLFLLLTNPSAVLVKKLLNMLFATNKVKEQNKTSSEKKKPNKIRLTIKKDNGQDDNHTKNNPNIGFTIGVLERVITSVLLLCNQYSAIGLVLTAKSLARFKQLDDRDFAEKYIVGTLTSLLISLIATIFIQKLI